MKITIEGSDDQVRGACREVAAAIRPGRPRSRARQERYDQIVANRRIIRAAFDIIRYDPAEQDLVKTFARALGGIRGDITETLLETARQIIKDHTAR